MTWKVIRFRLFESSSRMYLKERKVDTISATKSINPGFYYSDGWHIFSPSLEQFLASSFFCVFGDDLTHNQAKHFRECLQ